MRWFNHELITGMAVFTTTGNIVAAVSAALGSSFPDVIEGRPGEEGSLQHSIWQRRHRKGSHWFVFYLIPLLFLLLYLSKNSSLVFSTGSFIEAIRLGLNDITALYPVIAYTLFYFLIGCIFHIAQDAITGTVPSLNPRKRTGVRFFTVGSIQEYIFTFSVVFLAVILYI